MPLTIYDFVYCTLEEKLRLYEVIRVISNGRPPRYELESLDDQHDSLTLIIGEESEWLNKYIFIDREQAVEDLERRTQEALDEWANDLFRDKKQLAQYFFQLWVDTDAWGNRKQGAEFRTRKVKMMAEKIEDFFGVTVDVSRDDIS